MGAARYFVYVSDTKVERLYATICSHTIESNFKMDASVAAGVVKVSGSFEPKRKATSELLNKVAKIDSYFAGAGRTHMEVGSVFDSTSYIKDTLSLRWILSPQKDPRRVIFVGQARDTVVGLIGSARHVLGAEFPERDSLEFLESLGLNLPTALRELLQDQGLDSTNQKDYAGAFQTIHEMLPGPAQNMEFLVKVLSRTRTPHGWLLIATPIYVALM